MCELAQAWEGVVISADYREGLVGPLDSRGNFNLGGYSVAMRPGSKFVELSIISGAGKIRQ